MRCGLGIARASGLVRKLDGAGRVDRRDRGVKRPRDLSDLTETALRRIPRFLPAIQSQMLSESDA